MLKSNHIINNNKPILVIITVMLFINFTYFPSKAYAWQQDLVNLSIKIRENELELQKLAEYKEVLELKRKQNINNLNNSKDNIINNMIALYKLSLTPIQSFLVGKKSINEVAITYSLFYYCIQYFDSNLKKTIEYIGIINKTNKEFQNIEKQITELNNTLRKNYQKLKKEIKQNNQNNIKSVNKENIAINKKIANVVDLMDKLNQSYYLLDSEKKLNKEFIKNKGNFIIPVTGFIESNYHSLDKRDIYYNGIQILAAPSSQIIAPFDGEIIFSEPFAGFQNLIIIKHAPSYLSIIAGDYDSFVKTYQIIKKHEPIALSKNKLAPIYFEIQAENIVQNPNDWIKTKN